MSQLSLKAVQEITCKKRDAWWTVFLVDPLATRLLMVLARFKFVTPNGVTWAALVFGLVSAGFFLAGDMVSLIIGAVLYHFSFVLDCVDGKLARLKNNGSLFGGWLDYVFDRVRVLFCATGLAVGQYLDTGEAVFLLVGLAIVFLDSLRYLDALQIYKMRAGMRRQIEKAMQARAAEGASGLEPGAAPQSAAVEAGVVFMEDLLRAREIEGEDAEIERAEVDAGVDVEADGEVDAEAATTATATTDDGAGVGAVVGAGVDGGAVQVDGEQPAGAKKVIDLQTEFRTKFPWYTRVRNALLARRVRPHLVSGIEFQMFVFIVGPLIGQILWTTVVSAVLMLAFELVIMYKFWLSTKDFNRVMAELSPAKAGTVGVIVPQAFKGYVAPAAAADVAAFVPAQSRTEAVGAAGSSRKA
jgi:phosphatidylglycerophosphate synthase